MKRLKRNILRRLRCLTGHHRMGATSTYFKGSDGYAYWPCMDCFRSCRLGALWAVPHRDELAAARARRHEQAADALRRACGGTR